MKITNLLRFIVLSIVLLSFTGCGWNVTLRPVETPDSSPSTIESAAPKYSAIILGGSMTTFDGGNYDPNNVFKESVAWNLRQTGIFKNVYTTDQAIPPSEKALLTFTSTQTFGGSTALAGIKGFLVGASFFLLAPVIPFYADASANFGVRVQKPDGSSRDYNAIMTGQVRSFFFSVKSGINDLVTKVLLQAEQAAVTKMANDRSWLQK